MSGFDRVADIYDSTRSLRPDVMAKAVDALLSHLGGKSLVDFGVGTGRFAAPLAAAGVRVIGLDISRKMIRQALSKGVADLLLTDAAAVPFRDLSFDYALAVHFVHLVDDWRAVLREIARVARDGLMTLIEDQEGGRPRDVYLEIREKMGYHTEKLRLGERDLVQRVTPAVVEEAARYEEVFDPQELLQEYSSKLHSVTWEIPDEVNERIVTEMAKRLGEKRTLERRLVLAGWTREQLQQLYLTP
jgi:ubiquinone/menaquinone biosynthesis C-methylase UbiE